MKSNIQHPTPNAEPRTSPTPGPWRFSTITLHNPERFTLLAGDREIALIEDRALDGSGEANLRLIEGAPKLLAACQRFTANYAQRGMGAAELDAVYRDCCDAIAKVEGA